MLAVKSVDNNGNPVEWETIDVSSDNTGVSSNITIDSSLSDTSTNPVQNKIVTEKFTELENIIKNKADTSKIPTSTNQLTNDSGFLTNIPSEYVTETELANKGYALQSEVTQLSENVTNLQNQIGNSSSNTGSGSSVQADYAQNDDTAIDYIKNRPFYKKSETIYDGDVTTVVGEDGVICYEYPSTIVDVNSLNIGDMFEVTTNDITHTYTLTEDVFCLGNIYLYCKQLYTGMGYDIDEILASDPDMAATIINTGETFCILFDETATLFVTEEAGTYHFIINGTIVQKFDSSFINWVEGSAPSSLPEVTTDDNDKVLMVVDGVWTAASIASGDEVAY